MSEPVIPEVSVIIVSWNSKEELKACLCSIAPGLGGVSHEVIVVDNASSDGTPGMVKELFPQFRLIANGDNRGFAAANNQGLALARGEYLLLLNPDTVLLKGAAGGLLDFMRSEPEAGAVGPAFLNGPGCPASIRTGIFRFPGLKDELFLDTVLGDISGLVHGLFRMRGRAPEAAGGTWPVEADWVSGACMLVRRQAMEEAGVLDPAFFLYMEELEWCYRIKRVSGWKILILPYLSIIHTCGASTAKRNAVEILAIYYDSRYKFFKKHWPPCLVLPLRLVKGLLLSLSVLKWMFIAAAVPAKRAAAAEKTKGLFAVLSVVLGFTSPRPSGRK